MIKMTWKDKIKKASMADELKSMFRLLRKARDAGLLAEEGIDYEISRMNTGAKRMPDDTESMSELERRYDEIYKATKDIQKIIDDLMQSLDR